MQAYEQLEIQWAEFNGLDPAGMVCCSSGSAALHLSLEAFRLPHGSEVLVPDYTMIACPRAVVLAGLTPVFVDCGDDLLMGCTDEARCRKSEAMMAVHVYGRRCDMDRLVHESEPRGLMIVEDLAEAHGVRPHSQTNAACWSFMRNKIVAGEEGGAVWFRDPAHAALARQLRCLGFTDAHDYDHVPRGHNYRMSNLHAGWILEGANDYGNNPNALDRYHDWGRHGRMKGTTTVRREIEAWYDAACPPEWRQPERQAVWVYDVRVPGWTRAKVLAAVRALRAAGVEARPGFLPMSAQKEFAGCRRVGGGNADRAADEVLYLPVQPGTTTPGLVDRAFEVLRREIG